MKKAKYHRILSNKLYYPEELAEAVGLCKHSIYRHIRLGLTADSDVRPFLIYGKDAKEYFREKNSREESRPYEFKCHGCKVQFTFPNVPVTIRSTGRRYSQDKLQVLVSGNCPECGRKFWRFKAVETRSEINRGAEIPIDMLTSGGKK